MITFYAQKMVIWREILVMGSSVYKMTTIFITLNNPESSGQQVLTQTRPLPIEQTDQN